MVKYAELVVNFLKWHVKALLSSKFIESLESITVEGKYFDEQGNLTEFDWAEFFTDIPEIEIHATARSTTADSGYRILFPKGQK